MSLWHGDIGASSALRRSVHLMYELTGSGHDKSMFDLTLGNTGHVIVSRSDRTRGAHDWTEAGGSGMCRSFLTNFNLL